MDIRLEIQDGSYREVLVGIPNNATELDQGIVDAVRLNRRLIPHVISHLACNIALTETERIPAMIDVRDRLLEAMRKEDGL
jgi:hypothetical protein